MALRPTLSSLAFAAVVATLTACSGSTTIYYVGADGGSTAQPGAGNSASGSSGNNGPDDGCTPSCGSRGCGDDGCGGVCGTCPGKQQCSAAGTCEVAVPPGVTCPPTGAVGTSVGKIAQAGTLPLASGGTYDLRANCAKPIYLLGVTETCGICMQELGVWAKSGNVLDQLKADGADVVLISTDNPEGYPGSPSTASALRTRFGFGTRFFLGYEPAGSTGEESFDGFIPKRTMYSGARIALILKPGNVIGALGQVDDVSDIRAALGL